MKNADKIRYSIKKIDIKEIEINDKKAYKMQVVLGIDYLKDGKWEHYDNIILNNNGDFIGLLNVYNQVNEVIKNQ